MKLSSCAKILTASSFRRRTASFISLLATKSRMKFRARILALFLSLLVGSPISADVELRRGSVAHFASVQEGAEIQSTRDDFIKHLSGFDRAVRMKTKSTPTTAELL